MDLVWTVLAILAVLLLLTFFVILPFHSYQMLADDNKKARTWDKAYRYLFVKPIYDITKEMTADMESEVSK